VSFAYFGKKSSCAGFMLIYQHFIHKSKSRVKYDISYAQI